MESGRSLYDYLVDVLGGWLSRISISNIFTKRESTPEQIPPQEPNSDEEIETAEERPAAIYITNVLCMFGRRWFKNILTPYGRIKRIVCLRVMPYEWSYLVIFASEDEARAAFIGMQNPPDVARDFNFSYVNHERLMNQYITLFTPNENVAITDY